MVLGLAALKCKIRRRIPWGMIAAREGAATLCILFNQNGTLDRIYIYQRVWASAQPAKRRE
jgi:hypothetical protein